MPNPQQALTGMNSALEALTPLDKEERERAIWWLAETLGVTPASTMKPKNVNEVATVSGKAAGKSPKKFLAGKQPQTDVERIACLAYFMTYELGTPRFKTRDLTDLNTEAAGRRFSNAAKSANNALNQNGYLAQAGKGQRQISDLGERVVEAMPNREAIDKVITSTPKTRRKSSKKASK